MKTYRAIALCFVMLLLTAGMAIDCKSETRDFSVGSGIDVSVFVYSERDPALSDEFIQRIEDRTVLMLRAMMGSNANVQMLRLPNLNGWLREHRLSDLSTQQ